MGFRSTHEEFFEKSFVLKAINLEKWIINIYLFRVRYFDKTCFLLWKFFFITVTLLEKCPNTKFFLVLIFPNSDWKRARKKIRIETLFITVSAMLWQSYDHIKSYKPYSITYNCSKLMFCLLELNRKKWSLYPFFSKNNLLNKAT